MSYRVPFNKPSIVGNELAYIREAISSFHLSGNGKFTQQAQQLLEDRFSWQKVLLTSSCTDAIEMAALLLDIQPGDEVIIPSYTFVSSANPFVLRGARIIFVDSDKNSPQLDVTKVAEQLTERTKAVIAVHYGGASTNMDSLQQLLSNRSIPLIEDAAQAVGGYFAGRSLGSFGTLSCVSFHETKNIIAGEGGALIINDPRYFERAEILWEKGTNRADFKRGRVSKYSWVDLGSSFLPSEITAAFLMGQLEKMEELTNRRVAQWTHYLESLTDLSEFGIGIPSINPLCQHNGHIFYLLCRGLEERNELIRFLMERSILAVSHYEPLHESPFYLNLYDYTALPEAERYGNTLLRLPLYHSLKEEEQNEVISAVVDFYRRT